MLLPCVKPKARTLRISDAPVIEWFHLSSLGAGHWRATR